VFLSRPANLPAGKLKESTWDRLADYLKKPRLEVTFENVLKPTKERPWMEKLKKVKLDVRKSTTRKSE